MDRLLIQLPPSADFSQNGSLGSHQFESALPQDPESEIYRADPLIHAQEELIRSWLTSVSNSPETRRAYFRVADELISVLHPMALKDATLPILQNFVEIKKYRKPRTIAQRVAIVKSLFSFAVMEEYLLKNPAQRLSVKLPKRTLADRYLPEEDVIRMIALTRDLRDRTIMKVLYSSGCRISELCGLKWKDVQIREEGMVQLHFHGKGKKEREVLVSKSTSQDLQDLRPNGAPDEDHVFRSQKKQSSFITPQRIRMIVRQAALRAGIRQKVSPHGFRHNHASHALDRGAPIHLVGDTLGHEDISTLRWYLHSRPKESSGKYLSI